MAEEKSQSRLLSFLKSAGYATGEKYTTELKPKVAWVKKNLKL